MTRSGLISLSLRTAEDPAQKSSADFQQSFKDKRCAEIVFWRLKGDAERYAEEIGVNLIGDLVSMPHPLSNTSNGAQGSRVTSHARHVVSTERARRSEAALLRRVHGGQVAVDVDNLRIVNSLIADPGWNFIVEDNGSDKQIRITLMDTDSVPDGYAAFTDLYATKLKAGETWASQDLPTLIKLEEDFLSRLGAKRGVLQAQYDKAMSDPVGESGTQDPLAELTAYAQELDTLHTVLEAFDTAMATLWEGKLADDKREIQSSPTYLNEILNAHTCGLSLDMRLKLSRVARVLTFDQSQAETPIFSAQLSYYKRAKAVAKMKLWEGYEALDDESRQAMDAKLSERQRDKKEGFERGRKTLADSVKRFKADLGKKLREQYGGCSSVEEVRDKVVAASQP